VRHEFAALYQRLAERVVTVLHALKPLVVNRSACNSSSFRSRNGKVRAIAIRDGKLLTSSDLRASEFYFRDQFLREGPARPGRGTSHLLATKVVWADNVCVL
jgi:hypothetical protein